MPTSVFAVYVQCCLNVGKVMPPGAQRMIQSNRGRNVMLVWSHTILIFLIYFWTKLFLRLIC